VQSKISSSFSKTRRFECRDLVVYDNNTSEASKFTFEVDVDVDLLLSGFSLVQDI
jgi:hypothetical protein